MSEKAVSDDLGALNLKNFLARRQPWWRLVSLGPPPPPLGHDQYFFPSYATGLSGQSLLKLKILVHDFEVCRLTSPYLPSI